MPVCSRCGAYSDDGKIFCPECGKKFKETPKKAMRAPDKTKANQPDWQKKYQQYRNKYPQYDFNTRNSVKSDEKSTVTDDDGGKTPGTLSLVFSILSFSICFFPAFSIVGLITGIVGVKKGGGTIAKTGLILSAISLAIFTTAVIICVINGFNFGTYMEKLKTKFF